MLQVLYDYETETLKSELEVKHVAGGDSRILGFSAD